MGNPDRSYKMTIHNPTSMFLVMRAAGITRGSMRPNSEFAGKITLKHVYEIAKIKSEDPCFECVPLQQICNLVIMTARSCGIEVVRTLDPQQYEQFLEERKLVVEQQLEELKEIKETKLTRAL